MEAAGLIEKVEVAKVLRFNFEDVKKLPPPIIAFSDVAFSYSGLKKDFLYKDLSFGIDMDSRYVRGLFHSLLFEVLLPSIPHLPSVSPYLNI